MRAMLTVTLLGLLAAGAARADCTAPDDPAQIPDGSTATRDQMLAAQKATRAYDTAVQAYGDCLKQEQDAKVAAAGGDKMNKDARAKMANDYAQRYNVQVDKLHAMADKFNEALKAWKAKNPS
jgi:hypothetical protein